MERPAGKKQLKRKAKPKISPADTGGRDADPMSAATPADFFGFDFFDIWQTNREHNAVCELRNADDLYVPPHRIELFNSISPDL